MSETNKPERIDGQYIYFWHDWMRDKPKTQVWEVFSRSGNDWLGEISWFAQWRRYAFRSTYKADGEKKYGVFLSDVWFEQTCQRDIANFCEELTIKHKKNLS